ncbi:DUF2298 domain-containing protein [Haloparvum sedimenti]|uniref:DUF2298 domain-containing protein n=1 Tax=Haloparvum sedimenti TaxID=1678448 RepID=UPI00071E76EE|nr:DUF2298 domain-containing protein [Haloparvum sedimenti]
MEYLLVGWWLLAFAALSALAFPLCARLFPRFPGYGAGLAPAVALATLTVVGYWTGRVSYGRHTLWVALAGLVAVSALVGLDRAALRRGEVRLAAERLAVDRSADDRPRPRRRDLIAPAAVFAAAFLLLVAVRNADPAITAAGGEKFLDYGLLRSLLRAESLPPYDVWFAGETVNYYYGGHLAAALLTRLAGTPPAYAYNLALAGFYATLAAAAFELARAVAAGRARGRGVDGDDAADHGLRAGLAGAFLVAVAGNLVSAARLAVAALPNALAEPVAHRLTRGTRVSPDDLLAGIEGFHYWTASRVIPGTINEFPFFGFLNGDLHAHMMGAPFLLLAAALLYAYWETPAERLRRRRLLAFGAIPVLGGLQVVVHTWDVATTLGLLWLTLTFAPAAPLSLLPRGEALAARLRGALGEGLAATEVARTGGALLATGVAAVGAGVLGAPFLLGASSGQEPALLAAEMRSALTPLILVHGAFLAAFGAYLVGRIADGASRDAALVAAGTAAVALASLAAGFPAFAVVVPLLALGWAAFRLDRGVGFETALIVGGAGLVGIVEVVFVVEEAGPGRMNTVFKVYAQVWALWATAAGIVLAELWATGFRGTTSAVDAATATDAATRRGSAAAERTADALGGIRARLPTDRTLARALVALLLLATAPYAPMALGQHAAVHDAGTLDATAFVEAEHPSEAAAIDWLDEEATHRDTLLEAPGASYSPEGLAANPGEPGIYTWRANPASSLTGIPTVAGWSHEVGYRGREAYTERVAAVDRAYAGSDAERVAALREYGVDYVWVGPTERDRYGDVSFDRFAGIEVAYETETVTVYRVDSEELAT